MSIAARLCTVPGLIMLVMVSAFKPMQAIAEDNAKPAEENHGLSVLADSGAVRKQLDYAWQPQYDVRPDWIDYDGIEQLSYAMGILLYDSVDEVNLSIEHIAQGMESQRRLKRKLGNALISVAQAQAIVKDHVKHQKAAAERFINKHWNEEFLKVENTIYREVAEFECDTEEKAGGSTDKTHYQYLLADGWNKRFPVEVSGADQKSLQTALKSIFCNEKGPNTKHWKISEFEFNDKIDDDLIKGLSVLLKKGNIISPGSVYDVVIPASDAYDDEGLAGVVMPHSAVRMLIRLHKLKPSN